LATKASLSWDKLARCKLVAEVYQTDIGKVPVKATAIITSESFQSTTWAVRLVGLQVIKQEITMVNPVNLDRKVIEVRI